MGWTATLRPNPTDPHPIMFIWDGGDLICSENSILRAVERLAANLPHVAATPTGPFEPPDLSRPHVAFRVVFELAMIAGMEPEDIEIEGEGWEWPGPDAPPPGYDVVY